MSSTQITPPSEKNTAPSKLPAPSRSHPVRTAIIFLLIVAVVGYFIWRIATARNKAAQQAAQQQALTVDAAIPVQVDTVEGRQMPIYVTALGTVTPYYTVTVKARVTGELIKVNFNEGQDVKSGDELMEIDPRPYQALLDQARGQLARDQAQLQNNQAEYNRYKSLYAQGIVSSEQLGTYQSNLGQFVGAIQADKAAIATAALNVAYCHITSPISGKVGLRLVDPGNIITANTTNLIVINQFQPIAVVFTLPEGQLPRVLEKMRGTRELVAEAFDRSDTHDLAVGKLRTADNQIDTTTGTVKFKAVFDNKDEILYPNQFVNIHLVLEQQPHAIVVPSAALQSGTNGDYVWLVKPDKTVVMQPVTIDTAEGTLTILASGVTPGETVVTDGADKLLNGAKVIPHLMKQSKPVNLNQGSKNGMMGS